MSDIKTFGVNDYDTYWKKRKGRGRTYKTPIHETLIATTQNHTPEGGSVLDIGVGPGHVYEGLQQSGFDCYGIEVSPEAMELYTFPKDKIILHDAREGIPEIQGTSKFDTIIVSHVIHHLEDVDGFLEICKKAMADDGVLLIGTPNTAFLPYRIKYMFKGEFPNVSHGHTNFLTMKEYESLFTKHNLEIKELVTNGKRKILRKFFPTLFAGTFFFVVKQSKN